MSSQNHIPRTEPVPSASQLAVLPFLAALEGILRDGDQAIKLRLTIHRAMNRSGRLYLQQVCPYIGPQHRTERAGVGRVFPVNEGIIGAAFGSGHVWRTRHYTTVDRLRTALKEDMQKTQDSRDVTTLPLSWLAIPFLGDSTYPVLVLYADAHVLNFFANDDRIRATIATCRGFCGLIDQLEESPMRNLRNFPFDIAEVSKGSDTVYPTIQEELTGLQPPAFTQLASFNFESSAV
jgi:hypothetical protein